MNEAETGGRQRLEAEEHGGWGARRLRSTEAEEHGAYPGITQAQRVNSELWPGAKKSTEAGGRVFSRW